MHKEVIYDATLNGWVSRDTTRVDLSAKTIKVKGISRVTLYDTGLVGLVRPLGEFRSGQVYMYCPDSGYHVVLLAAFRGFPLLIAFARLLFASALVPTPTPAPAPQVRGSDPEHDGSPDQQRQLPPGQTGPGLRFDGLGSGHRSHHATHTPPTLAGNGNLREVKEGTKALWDTGGLSATREKRNFRKQNNNQ